MGEANRRGSFKERQAEAIKRKELEQAEELKRDAERRRLREEYYGRLPESRREMVRSKPVRARRLMSIGVGIGIAACYVKANTVD